ncbi:GRIP domain-containing protein RUD3-like [Pyrus ussuriensis x Pyrus communis]|uniref:GRIP domain-containing protein RUD3-like n=1 Tax=Pyrus ussuriensis x Pyrus communis TaxID=2448454 RepID=A0A5N5GKD6_9ROSA|nr:GRIP domain-containing protein RUD3-like [Pyrus ussuriensis x Pyrus communis]
MSEPTQEFEGQNNRNGVQPLHLHSSMLDYFSVNGHHHINCSEVFVEESRDLTIVKDKYLRAVMEGAKSVTEFVAWKLALVAVEVQESRGVSSFCSTFTIGEFLIECSLVERDSGSPKGLSDEGSPSSSSRFEPTMSKSSGHLLESLEKVSKKKGTSTKKGKTPIHKSQDEVLKIVASKKAEAEAIGCAAAIVAGEEKLLFPHLSTIDPIFPSIIEFTGQEIGSIPRKDLKVAMQPSSFTYVNNCLPLAENESDRDRMMRLSSYVMIEYDDKLREVERYKAKFKENKRFMDDTRKKSKALIERLTRRNGENLRLKKELEMTILEASKVKGKLDSALVEVSKLKGSIPTERETVVSEEESENKASVDEQTQQGEDDLRDAEDSGDGDDGETQSDIIRGSTSNEDDSYCLHFLHALVSCLHGMY